MTREVLEIIPRYLGYERVLSIGEQNDDMGAISFMGIIVLSTIATTEFINKLNEAVWVCNGNHSKKKSHVIYKCTVVYRFKMKLLSLSK